MVRKIQNDLKVCVCRGRQAFTVAEYEIINEAMLVNEMRWILLIQDSMGTSSVDLS
jgi:hypothetical protein